MYTSVLLQDTVIGLQALSEFATLVYSKDTDMQITVTGGNYTQACNVTQQNALVLQSIPVIVLFTIQLYFMSF